MIKKSWLIMDGQFGSTGKGLIAGYLALKREPDTVVNNFGPNAGHTTVLNDGTKVMVQMLPSAIVSPSVKRILIGPGAIIDPWILMKEIDKYEDLLKGKEIFIHPMATLVTEDHKRREAAELNRISSTCKGTGAAQTDKIMRKKGAVVKECNRLSIRSLCTPSVMDFMKMIVESKCLQIESAQGMELGINTGDWYPYCTSRDINVYQILSDCGIPYGSIYPEIIVSMRTYPIRVGNAFDIFGKLIGVSGPVYDDQTELSWDKLNVEEEKTTVTNKVRRVFTWSWKNFDKVMTILNPHSIFLNFVNYLEENPQFGHRKTGAMIKEMETRARISYPLIKWIGTGPMIKDVISRPISMDIDEA